MNLRKKVGFQKNWDHALFAPTLVATCLIYLHVYSLYMHTYEKLRSSRKARFLVGDSQLYSLNRLKSTLYIYVGHLLYTSCILEL